MGGCHFLVVTTRSLGFTVGSVKIEKIHKPGTKLNTNKKDGWLGTNESDGIHGGRTIIDFELGVNASFNSIITELITFRSNNKIVFNMVNASFVSTGFLKAKA